MITNLFRFELRKILKNSSTYVCLILLLSFLALEVVFLGLLDYSFTYDGQKVIYEFNPMAGYSILDLPFYEVIAIFLCIYLTKDYSDGTIKNIYGRGISRTAFFFVRFVVCVLLSTAFFVLFYLTEYVSTSLVFDTWKIENSRVYFRLMGLEFLTLIVYATSACFICSFAKKPGNAIIISIFGPLFIFLLCNIGDTLLSEYEVNPDVFNFNDCWYENYSGRYGHYLSLSEPNEVFNTFSTNNVIVNLGWIAFYIAFGWINSSGDKI